MLKKKRKRGSYNCSKCGKPKKGHFCEENENSNYHFSIDNPSTPKSSSSSSSTHIDNLIQELQDLREENFFLKNEIVSLQLKLRNLGVYDISLTHDHINIPILIENSQETNYLYPSMAHNSSRMEKIQLDLWKKRMQFTEYERYLT